MAKYVVAKSSNPNYWVHIVCPKHNFDIVCDMPEQLAFGISSEWESALPYTLSGLLEKAIGNIATTGAAVIGVSPVVQALSYQMWTGTTPIEIPITILFDAEESAQKDVYEPIVYLQSLALPVNGALGMLYPPGPIWAGDRGYGIHVKLGKYILFENCIMVSANKTFDSRLDAAGFPISGQIECVFRTSKVYGHSDFLTAMNLPPISGSEDGKGGYEVK